MVLGHRVRSLIGIRSDAFSAGYVNERVIPSLMSLFGYGPNGFQLLCRIEKAFIAARNVVIDLDAEDVALLRLTYDLLGVV
jgi:hypothetical protein